MDTVIKLEAVNHDSIKLIFESGRTETISKTGILNSEFLNDFSKQRWRNMFEKGAFLNAELSMGDIVWVGWCEILSEEIDNFIDK